MCGIVGYVGDQEAVPILIGGLAKLEYRGYDSAGVAVLLVEQNVPMSLQIADRGIVLANGHIVVSGTGADLLHNSDVTNAYLAA